MSGFDFDDLADVDGDELEALADQFTDEELAAYFEDPIDPDPLAGYSHAVSPSRGAARPFPDARARGIADLPGI
ncbi:hypothetical protein [Streptomyces swartbergensis]|uniref:Uncharacterized protein n=1 Tax=Streptomyces swartbergensis TaxID=487165 RepID=A0A243RS37_9ACTN|nr:hypothetical protein [Streptomyces swartbergensis]OUC97816.1 hypothetical protein CA983_29970 [Streptomyces swartbergensis]